MEANTDVLWRNPPSILRIHTGKVPRTMEPQAEVKHTHHHKQEPVEITVSKIRSIEILDLEMI